MSYLEYSTSTAALHCKGHIKVFTRSAEPDNLQSSLLAYLFNVKLQK